MYNVQQLGRLFHGIAMVANAAGTLVIFALIALMNADVFSRNFFDAPLRGVVEMVIFSLVLIVFLQLPDVVRKNRLTRSDGFLVLGRNRFPRFTNVLDRTIDLAAAVFMAMITWTMWPEFTESIATCHFLTAPEFGPAPTGEFIADLKVALARCEYFGTPGVFTAPWWPAKLAIVFSSGLCTVIFCLKVVSGEHRLPDGKRDVAA
ncbi:MAG: TRAP transporter small permease subunit [Granulosicoccus sp.]